MISKSLSSNSHSGIFEGITFCSRNNTVYLESESSAPTITTTGTANKKGLTQPFHFITNGKTNNINHQHSPDIERESKQERKNFQFIILTSIIFPLHKNYDVFNKSKPTIEKKTWNMIWSCSSFFFQNGITCLRFTDLLVWYHLRRTHCCEDKVEEDASTIILLTYQQGSLQVSQERKLTTCYPGFMVSSSNVDL